MYEYYSLRYAHDICTCIHAMYYVTCIIYADVKIWFVDYAHDICICIPIVGYILYMIYVYVRVWYILWRTS